MIGIYKIVNNINGKVYIGQSQNIEKRWIDHKSFSKREVEVLYRAMRKYGIENFSLEVVEECSIEELSDKERFYIGHYNSYIHAENSNGYNMTLGGEGTRGVKIKEETREKMRQRMLGGKNHNYGKPLSEEVKQKISKTVKGRYKGENNPMYGKCHSEEALLKMTRGNNYKARKTMCGGKMFDCLKDCAEYYGIKYGTIKCWLSLNKIPKKYEYLNLHYATDKEIQEYGNS